MDRRSCQKAACQCKQLLCCKQVHKEGSRNYTESNRRYKKKEGSETETDWDLVESFCLCELGLSVKEYYALTLRQFELLSNGFKRQVEIKRSLAIDSWRQTRLIAFLIARDSLKDKNISMYDFYP